MAESSSVVDRCIAEHAAVLSQLDSLKGDIVRAGEILSDCVRAGKTILLAGNGGSAADAQHIAGEFVGRFLMERRGFSAIALNTNDATLTSIGNDYGYEHIFARQIESFGPHSGVFVGYSTSGNSANVLLAAEKAREMGLRVIGMTGASGGKLKGLCDVCLCVPSGHTPRIQEMHALIGHILCEVAEPCIV